ncbi:hypothetical protein QE152_g22181 [Popillia japonica]|uniref:Uncharacterized protein n=1 Tax=Popillia japonica TaxID=7064 RepID=A0AAW1KJH7_POPJA
MDKNGKKRKGHCKSLTKACSNSKCKQEKVQVTKHFEPSKKGKRPSSQDDFPDFLMSDIDNTVERTKSSNKRLLSQIAKSSNASLKITICDGKRKQCQNQDCTTEFGKQSQGRKRSTVSMESSEISIKKLFHDKNKTTSQKDKVKSLPNENIVQPSIPICTEFKQNLEQLKAVGMRLTVKDMRCRLQEKINFDNCGSHCLLKATQPCYDKDTQPSAASSQPQIRTLRKQNVNILQERLGPNFFQKAEMLAAKQEQITKQNANLISQHNASPLTQSFVRANHTIRTSKQSIGTSTPERIMIPMCPPNCESKSSAVVKEEKPKSGVDVFVQTEVTGSVPMMNNNSPKLSKYHQLKGCVAQDTEIAPMTMTIQTQPLPQPIPFVIANHNLLINSVDPQAPKGSSLNTSPERNSIVSYPRYPQIRQQNSIDSIARATQTRQRNSNVSNARAPLIQRNSIDSTAHAPQTLHHNSICSNARVPQSQQNLIINNGSSTSSRGETLNVNNGQSAQARQGNSIVNNGYFAQTQENFVVNNQARSGNSIVNPDYAPQTRRQNSIVSTNNAPTVSPTSDNHRSFIEAAEFKCTNNVPPIPTVTHSKDSIAAETASRQSDDPTDLHATSNNSSRSNSEDVPEDMPDTPRTSTNSKSNSSPRSSGSSRVSNSRAVAANGNKIQTVEEIEELPEETVSESESPSAADPEPLVDSTPNETVVESTGITSDDCDEPNQEASPADNDESSEERYIPKQNNTHINNLSAAKKIDLMEKSQESTSQLCTAT